MADVNKLSKSEVLHDFHFLSHQNLNTLKHKQGTNSDTLFWSGCHVVNISSLTFDVRVFQFPDTVLDIDTDDKNLLILLTSGYFVKVKIPQNEKRKNEPNIKTESMDIDKEDIFGELLNGSKEDQEEDDIQIIGPDHYICYIPNAYNFLIIGRMLVVLIYVKNIMYKIIFFDIEKAFNKDYMTSGCIAPSERTEILPLSNNITLENTVNHFIIKEPQKCMRKCENLIMACCHKTGMSINDNSKYLKLEDQLFQKLFGTNLTIAESPVVLVSLPCGKVYFMAVKTVPGSISVHNQILYHLEQPVCAIKNVTFELSDEWELDDAMVASSDVPHKRYFGLVLVGLYGKIVLLYWNMGNGRLDQQEDTVPGPVYSIDVVKNVLLHSTLLSTFHSEMWIDKDHKVKSLAPEILGFNSATGLAVITKDKGAGPALQPQGMFDMLAITSMGRMYRLQVDLKGALRGWKTFKTAGHQIGDLVTSLGRVSHKLDDVNRKISLQDNVIEQLNIASLTINAYRNQELMKDAPVMAEARIEYQTCRTYVLLVTLKTNDICLSSDWHVTVSIDTLDPPSSISKVVQLSKLSKELVIVQVLSCEMLRNFPANVVVHLTLAVPVNSSVMSLPNQHKSGETTRYVNVPLLSKTFDILHLLIPLNSSCEHNIANRAELDKVIKTLANERPFGKKGEDASEYSAIENTSCTFTIPTWLYNMKGKKHSDAEVLQLLLQDNSNVTCQESSRLKAVTPSNNQVLLNVEGSTSSGGQQREMHIHTVQISELCALRQAVMSRLQKFYTSTEYETKEVPAWPSHQLRRYLRGIEDINDELESLQQSEGRFTESEQVRKVFQLYSALRNSKTPQ